MTVHNVVHRSRTTRCFKLLAAEKMRVVQYCSSRATSNGWLLQVILVLITNVLVDKPFDREGVDKVQFIVFVRRDGEMMWGCIVTLEKAGGKN